MRDKLTTFHQQLQRWYDAHGRRTLPWRNTQDPYAIYLSEVMLQQTQVETVRAGFYPAFLTRFPTLNALAAADAEDVLSAWQGLGYYSRARNLHRSAQQCKSLLPKTVEELIALPGIGKNTAHAIAAFAYHQAVPVMEANVKRVLCRIFALDNPSDKELWEKATTLLNHNNPFDYNQAMMDIGAMICTKRAPKCTQCPANSLCSGKENPESYPQVKKKKNIPIRHKYITLHIDSQGHVQATPRTTRFLQGMYHFDEQEQKPANAQKIGEIEQSYSHFTLNADIYIKQTTSHLRNNNSYTLAQLHKLPMSMAEKKILHLLEATSKKT